jgi:hypothetical protein
MSHVIFHKGRDKVVAVVVALVPPQGQRLSRLATRFFEDLGVELLFEELVRGPLVYQYAASIGPR